MSESKMKITSREEFKRYVEKTGTTLVLQKALATLYVEFNKSNGECDPLSFLADYLLKHKASTFESPEKANS